MKYELDITKEHCPMTFVRVKLMLTKMKDGDTLEVLLTEGEPLKNVPESCKRQGYTILEISHVKDNVHKVVVQK